MRIQKRRPGGLCTLDPPLSVSHLFLIFYFAVSILVVRLSLVLTTDSNRIALFVC